MTVVATPYGAPAYVSLAEAVAAAKVDDPLATVTLVVPGERVGVAARRALARGLSPRRPGVAALRVLTVRRLAETLVGDAFARDGRRPLTGPVLAAAVRHVLRTERGMFTPVAEHIGTVRAVARAYRRLRVLSEEQLDKIAATAHAVPAETVRLHRLVRRRCEARFFDEVDLLDAAVVAADSELFGSAVVFLPQDLDPPEVALLGAVARVSDLRLVLGLMGEPRADAGPLAVCRALGVHDCGGAARSPVGDVVVDASDPDDEVRHVVRRVVSALVDRPGHRVGVFYGAADPYARLVHEHLARAGVEVFGRGVRPTAEGRLGRSVLRLLALARNDFRRGEVLGLVTDAPLWHEEGRVPSSAWERVSRAAGVVRGDDWTRLKDYAAHQERWLGDHPDAEPWQVDRAGRETHSARSLFDFVGELRRGLSEVDCSRSWREMGDAALRLWSSLLGGDALAPEERRAAERIASTLGSLSGLDAVAGEPDPALLRELLEVELSDDLDRVGRAGTGVHVGPVAEGVGEDLDVVFVVGAAEGLLPARVAEDPLLPDRVRELTDGALPTARERVARQHRQLLATLAAAPPGGRMVSFPRGDLRQGGTRMLSRWLNPRTRIGVPSYAGAVERECCPATPQEWRQRAVVEHLLDSDPVMTKAIEARRARAGSEFTAFDGNLAGETLPDPTDGVAVSATALEAWVQCPHGYFLRHLLRVAPVRQPEEVVRISALDRGTVMHDVLERLVSRAVSEGWAPGPGQQWPERSRLVLSEVAHERFARAEAEGVTGFGLLWELDRQAMLADLVESVTRDDERRRCCGGLTPVAAEWSFDHVEFPLGDGRILALKGRIDRIDRATDGALVVTDYKTGKAKWYLRVEEDPCDRGHRLQLAVYAQAARADFGDQDTVVRSEYWFATRLGGFRRIGHVIDPPVLDRVRQALRIVVDGIAGGVFLARARNAATNTLFACPGCDLGEHGNEGVAAAWERKAGAVELAGLRTLLCEDG
ncbi:PD-(D/E)XK nuclease family protein [Actinophytocola sp.]|uniref:PD-(D/E)XK nuclease family protein n=1 Tax=Actinophytocola sp. TaxID=1872138 RepID=UPI002ED32899